MSALKTIIKYTQSRKTAPTAYEVSTYTGLNHKTVKNILGMNVGVFFDKGSVRTCRVTGQKLTTYRLI